MVISSVPSLGRRVRDGGGRERGPRLLTLQKALPPSTVAPCLPLCCLHSSSKCLILIPPRQEASGYLVCTHPRADGRVGRRDIQLSRGHLGGSSLGAHPQSLGSGRVGGRRVLDSSQSLFGRVHPSCLITLPSPFLVQLQSQM